MSVLIDSSVWIDYFRGTGETEIVDLLIEENLAVTNDLILAELAPPLLLGRHKRLVALLRELKRYPVSIDWDEIVQMQLTCLRNGINGVGIPDLIIVQHAIRNDLQLLTADRHFTMMSEHLPLLLYGG